MMLAAIGIYGVMAYQVEQRTRELGVRIALGAQTVDVLSLVLKRNATLIGIGVAVGLAGSWALSRAMSQYFQDMGGVDPTAFAASSALLAFVAITASYLPRGVLRALIRSSRCAKTEIGSRYVVNATTSDSGSIRYRPRHRGRAVR